MYCFTLYCTVSVCFGTWWTVTGSTVLKYLSSSEGNKSIRLWHNCTFLSLHLPAFIFDPELGKPTHNCVDTLSNPSVIHKATDSSSPTCQSTPHIGLLFPHPYLRYSGLIPHCCVLWFVVGPKRGISTHVVWVYKNTLSCIQMAVLSVIKNAESFPQLNENMLLFTVQFCFITLLVFWSGGMHPKTLWVMMLASTAIIVSSVVSYWKCVSELGLLSQKLISYGTVQVYRNTYEPYTITV